MDDDTITLDMLPVDDDLATPFTFDALNSPLALMGVIDVLAERLGMTWDHVEPAIYAAHAQVLDNVAQGRVADFRAHLVAGQVLAV